MTRLNVLGNASVFLKDCWPVPGQEQLHLTYACNEDTQKQCMRMPRMYESRSVKAPFIPASMFARIFAEEKHTVTKCFEPPTIHEKVAILGLYISFYCISLKNSVTDYQLCDNINTHMACRTVSKQKCYISFKFRAIDCAYKRSNKASAREFSVDAKRIQVQRLVNTALVSG